MARYAVVIGANGPAEFGTLQYAEQDASSFSRALASPRNRFDVTTLIAPSDPYALRREVDTVVAHCSTEDTLICYFAGHGILEGGELYLILAGSTSGQLISTAFPVDALLTSIRRCAASNKLLILDCCHAGGAAGMRSGTMLEVAETSIPQANHLVLMASGRLERAREFEGLQAGFLTSSMCSALGWRFFEADTDNDLRLSIDEMMKWLDQEASSHNRYHKDKVPVPRLYGEQQGTFFFSAEYSWTPHEVSLPDGSQLVILPACPLRLRSAEFAVAVSRNLVTNAQYRQYVGASGASEPHGQRYSHDKHRWVGNFYPWRDREFTGDNAPVVCVSYEEAVAYAQWTTSLLLLSHASTRLADARGIRVIVDLPPYRIWDFATFGTDHPSEHPSLWASYLPTAHQKSPAPAPIDGNTRTNTVGVNDLIGNVWEWCCSASGMLDRAGFLPSDAELERRSFLIARPRQKEPRDIPQVRGGGYLDDLREIQPFLRLAELPQGPRTRHSDLGFRLGALIPTELLPADVVQYLELQRPLELAFRIERGAFLGTGESSVIEEF